MIRSGIWEAFGFGPGDVQTDKSEDWRNIGFGKCLRKSFNTIKVAQGGSCRFCAWELKPLMLSRQCLRPQRNDNALLCATSVFSVSLWCVFARNSSTTETQRTQRLHREFSRQDL